MMQMLDRGGIPALTDRIREADTDNPRGYYEFERVKKMKTDPSWLPEARGKAVKLISSLLYDLPATESYRVIFMEREIDEVLTSQEKMLQRLGQKAAPREAMKQSFAVHLERLFDWLPRQPHLQVLRVNYNKLLEDPSACVGEVGGFLGGRVATAEMMAAIDAGLYRNRA